jgi:hypothetical protein
VMECCPGDRQLFRVCTESAVLAVLGHSGIEWLGIWLHILVNIYKETKIIAINKSHEINHK